MKRILLTGVSGFVGSHVLRYLLERTDWNIIGIASWKHKGTPERVEHALRDHPEWLERVEIVTHDLISPFTETTIRAMRQIDGIVNIASESHVFRSITEPVYFVQNNINLLLTLLELARVKKPEFFLQFSTDEVYGVAPQGVDFPEWSPLVPSNAYSASKAAQEVIAIAYWRTYGVPLIITNTMNLFGETQDREKFIPMLIYRIKRGRTVIIHGNEQNIGSRFYLHVRNCASALLFLLRRKPAQFEDGKVTKPDRFNIVGDIELDNLTLARKIAELVGKPLVHRLEDFHLQRPGHDRRYSLSGAKLKKLGWKSPMSFEDSLKQCVEWTLKNPEWL
jgi:dTDP-glucose 4,6-dehydratase